MMMMVVVVTTTLMMMIWSYGFYESGNEMSTGVAALFLDSPISF
jgi:hypothetical protein